ncbi:hypothetical protein IE4872_CH01954 [Rhizobium gallicum]|uniref:Uncharacterized protein n=1 Tax=Rhizobium gallicum TaxID=56730 RepID=A0A1L5NI74_9HYPH|nr:hypothetical protein IE4872_CH01954 [Rhizobium gallicum]
MAALGAIEFLEGGCPKHGSTAPVFPKVSFAKCTAPHRQAPNRSLARVTAMSAALQAGRGTVPHRISCLFLLLR